MFQETVKKQVVAVYFVAVSVLMHFFLVETLDIGIWITYRHLFALLLVFSAFISFLLSPNLARGAVAFKSACVMAVPLLVMTTVSLLVWAINRTDFDMISRGLSYYLIYTNQFTSFLAAGAMLYLRGAGRRVPEDVRVVGVGDGKISRVTSPTLTSAHLYYNECGRKAASILLEHIGGETPVQEIRLGYQVVERESTE